MAISTSVDVIQTALWPQQDGRDPLGVWGFRVGVTGDATGGGIAIVATVPAALRAAYLYTCYSLNFAVLTGVLAAGAAVKARLLTNWPDVDPVPGIQAYGSLRIANTIQSASFTAPTGGIDSDILGNNDRYLLLWSPQATGADMDIVAMELSENVNLATYSFEGYGYFWDRSVINFPGGPRHPGSQ